MNSAILHFEVQAFINDHLKSDPTSLILKGVNFDGVTTTEIVEQIEAKKRCEKKLPTWFQQQNIYYPNKLNIEQTSSEVTAAYKSQLITGETLIDLTGGFGVDAYYFSKKFEKVSHCELNPQLSEIVSHNLEVLKVKNIETIIIDGLNHLRNTCNKYDWIYVDPSRRHESKGKIFFLKDSLPNIPEHLNLLWSRSTNILIKTSPLLDISSGINELEYVKSIHIIAVNNEVKEVLWILEHGFTGKIAIESINKSKIKSEHFGFLMDDELMTEARYCEPLTYLYEPNAAIMKSGGFNALASSYNVNKLHKHSHLYTSDTLVDFPGRAFKVVGSIPYHKKEIKKLSLEKANVTTRNFPGTVQKIRKAFKIKDGGERYLFFTTNCKNERIVIDCLKVN